MKRKQIFKITALSVAMMSLSSVASAQWAVSDATGQRLINAVKGSVDSVRETANIQIKQQDLNQLDTDVRLRAALGQADIAKRDFEGLPTVPQCVEITKSRGKADSIAASRGSGGGASGAGRAQRDRDAKIVNVATAQAATLEGKGQIGTCGTLEADSGIAGCTGGVGVLSGADINIGGLTSNTKNGTVNPGVAGFRDQVNLSMDAETFDAAFKNANDSTMYAAPGVPTEQELARNPVYMAMYASLMRKLDASKQVLVNIAKQYKESPNAPANWAQDRASWQDMFRGETWTPRPSKMELLRFNAYYDYLKPTGYVAPTDPIKVQENMMKLMTINNVLAYENMLKQDQTNILLAHLLTQQTTPVNPAAVNAELAKTKNLR